MFVKEIKLSKLSVISAENELVHEPDAIHICVLGTIFKHQKYCRVEVYSSIYALILSKLGFLWGL